METWFVHYTRAYTRRSFHTIHLLGDPPRFDSFADTIQPTSGSVHPLRRTQPDTPLLVCVNHSSWWDVLIGLLVEKELFGWEWYAVMDARQLKRYRFFSKLGVIGVDRERLAGAREFVRYSTALLKHRRRSLWLTPQGAMLSNQARPIRFQPGIAHLAESLGTFDLAHVTLHYEFWDERLPEAFVSVSPIQHFDTRSEAWNRKTFLHAQERALETQLDTLQQAAQTRDSTRFRPLLQGNTGISPVYDALRRLGSSLRGEKFTAAHGDVVTPQWKANRTDAGALDNRKSSGIGIDPVDINNERPDPQ